MTRAPISQDQPTTPVPKAKLTVAAITVHQQPRKVSSEEEGEDAVVVEVEAEAEDAVAAVEAEAEDVKLRWRVDSVNGRNGEDMMARGREGWEGRRADTAVVFICCVQARVVRMLNDRVSKSSRIGRLISTDVLYDISFFLYPLLRCRNPLITRL